MSSSPFLPRTISLVDRHSGIYQGTGRCRCSHSTGAITADTVQIERSGCSGTSADSEHLYSITHRPSRDLISCCSDMGIVTALSFPGAGGNRPHGCVYGLRPGNPTGRANPRLQRYRRTDCPAENQLHIKRKTP